MEPDTGRYPVCSIRRRAEGRDAAARDRGPRGADSRGLLLRPPREVLAVTVLVLVFVAAAGGASEPATKLASALGVEDSSVLEAMEIGVDGRVVGLLGRYESAGRGSAVVVAAETGRILRLGEADDLWFSGLVDLAAEQPLPSGRRLPRRLRTEGAGRPALLFRTRVAEAVSPDPRTAPLSSRRTGTREVTRLFIVELGAVPTAALRLDIQVRAADGYGGYDVGGLELRREGGSTYLEGVRQDRLPAHRARCRRPEPYPVRYHLVDGRFRDSSVAPARSPCAAGS